MQAAASCAVCGAPSSKRCNHEDDLLKKALDDSSQRWLASVDVREIRHWVLDHARRWIVFTFNQMAEIRKEQYEAHLATLPYHELFKIYSGRPPISELQIHQLRVQMSAAQAAYQRGLDEDWRNSLHRYPEVLDYYFGLVKFELPSDRSAVVQEPVFGGRADDVEVKRREVKGPRGQHPLPPMSMPGGLPYNMMPVSHVGGPHMSGHMPPPPPPFAMGMRPGGF